MNNCNESVSNSKQIYTHVKKSKTAMPEVQELMLNILKQYQQVDKVGYSLGVMDRSSSFSDAVSWCSVIGKLDHNKKELDNTCKEHLTESVDYLEELNALLENNIVPKIQKYRDKWMRRVLVWDLLLVSIMFVLVFLGLLRVGITPESEMLYGFVLQRPLFFTLTGILVVALVLQFHFYIRNRVVNNLLEKLDIKLPPGMSLKKSLLVNARLRHSIFRPDPVGWNLIQKMRLKTVVAKTAAIRQQLATVLDKYSDTNAEKEPA